MPNAIVPAAATGLPSRRTALASLAGLGAALSLAKAAQAAPAADHPDARLLALGAKLDRIEEQAAPLRDIVNAIDDTTHPAFDAYDALEIAGRDLSNLIAEEPAATVEGFAVKARAVSYIYHEGVTIESLFDGQKSTDYRLIVSIVTGLLAIGGAA
jgi:hypothetical protein